MSTDLFLSSSGLALDALAAVVPPSCRREVERAPDPRLESDATVLGVSLEFRTGLSPPEDASARDGRFGASSIPSDASRLSRVAIDRT